MIKSTNIREYIQPLIRINNMCCRKTLYIFIFSCLLGCGGSPDTYTTILNQAERLINEQPDSISILLSSIHFKDIREKKNKARFALLYSRTLDKNSIDIKDAPLMHFAVNYYAKNGTAIEKSTAYYYLARIYDNIDNLDKCIGNLILASEFVPDNSYHIKGLIYDLLASKYHEQHSYADAITHYKISLKAYGKCNNRAHQGIIFSNMASSLRSQERYEEALKMGKNALKIFTDLKDTTNILSSIKSIAKLNIQRGIPIKEIKDNMFKSYNKYNYGEVPASDYYLVSNLYIQLNNIDSARYYLNIHSKVNAHKPDSRNKIAILLRLKDIEKKLNNYKKAMEYSDSAETILDSISLAEDKQLIQELSEKHKSKLYKISFKKERRRTIAMAIFAVLLFMALLFCILFIFYIKKYVLLKKNNELNKFESQAIVMLEAQLNLQERYKSLLFEIKSNDLEEVDAINKIERTLFRVNDLLEKIPRFQTNPAKFITFFIEAMHTSTNDDKAHIHLRYIANKKHNGIISYLQSHYTLSPFEIDLCSMICLGFSIDTIRVLYSHDNPQSIYNKRSKLRAKLGLSGKDHIETFIRNLKDQLAKDHEIN